MAKTPILLNADQLAQAFGVTHYTLRAWIRKEEAGERNLGINEALIAGQKPRVWQLTTKLHQSIKVIRIAHRRDPWTPPAPTE